MATERKPILGKTGRPVGQLTDARLAAIRRILARSGKAKF